MNNTIENIFDDIRNTPNPGRSFEIFCKWFLENDPYWKTQIDQVWLWEHWPNNWGKDLGIDLIFKHKNGDHWAVQSKFYDNDYYIKKNDVDSFLSESNRPLIQKRLLIGTTDKIGPNAIKALAGQEKPVISYLLDDFERSGVECPQTLYDLDKKDLQINVNQFRPYQKEAIDKVVQGFKENDRGKLTMACGTGKTLVTLWIKEQMQPNTTLVLLPSLNLLSQTLFEWTKNAKDNFEVKCVCSDESVGKDSSEDMKITEASFDVTNDINEISNFLNLTLPKVIFCTYQSSYLISQAQENQSIDLVICDEAHRCSGLSSSTFTKVLDNKNIKAQKRLFTTATPRIFSKFSKTKASQKGEEIFGMDDEKIYGPDFFEYNFGNAIDDGWLTDYQVVIVGVDEPEVKKLIDHRELISVSDDKYEDAETLASKISIAKAIKEYDINRAITFHNRVQEAKEFSNDFLDVVNLLDSGIKPDGKIWIDHVSGKMSTKERRLKLAQLKSLQESNRGIISNARCLSEGVDVPALDGVIFVAPKASQVDIIQSVGRALRKSEEKKVGTIVLPVFINPGEDENETIENSNFKPIWNVLKALRSHDNRLAVELDDLRQSLGNKTKLRLNLPEKIHFDLPTKFNTNFISSINTILVENTSESWMTFYGCLSEYVQKNNQICPLDHISENGIKIGNWVNKQRGDKKNNRLESHKIILLEKLKSWDWDPLETKWFEVYNHLKDYVSKHKKFIPASYELSNGMNLNSWIVRLRSEYKKKILSKEKIALLEKIPGWTWDTNELAWQQGYDYLKKHINEYNKVPFNKHITTDGFGLGNWISHQRKNYFANSLSQERIALLENLKGWEWDPVESIWYRSYEALKKYIDDNNQFATKNFVTEDGIKLSSWAVYQRGSYKNKLLSNEKIKLIEKLPGWEWDPIEALWNKGFEYLKKYLTKFNKLPIDTYITDDDYKLGNWVNSQRRNYRNKVLTKDKIKLLEAIPCWYWDHFENSWNQAYEKLSKHIETIGNFPLKSGDNDEQKLASWITHQRRYYKTEKLSDYKIKSLEKIPNWDWNPVETQWQEAYNCLNDYYNINKKIGEIKNLTHKGLHLGQWLRSQRTNYKKKILSKDKIFLLEKFSDWDWDPLETQWYKSFNELKEFEKKYEKIPSSADKDHKSLNSWITNQRSNRKKKILPKDKIKLLNSIKNWDWDPTESAWQKGFSYLLSYVKLNNKVCTQDYITDDGYNLGRWINSQRNIFKNNTLTKDKIKLLEKVSGWEWEPTEAAWQTGHNYLLKYIKENRKICPSSYINNDNFALGNWVAIQRGKYRKKSLSSDKVNLLEKISCWEWDPIEAYWDKCYQNVEIYINKNDKLPPQSFVTDDGLKVGVWINTLRKIYKDRRLPEDKVAKLEQLRHWRW
jgi:superfamily II DNA or RNA helicase